MFVTAWISTFCCLDITDNFSSVWSALSLFTANFTQGNPAQHCRKVQFKFSHFRVYHWFFFDTLPCKVKAHYFTQLLWLCVLSSKEWQIELLKINLNLLHLYGFKFMCKNRRHLIFALQLLMCKVSCRVGSSSDKMIFLPVCVQLASLSLDLWLQLSNVLRPFYINLMMPFLFCRHPLHPWMVSLSSSTSIN